MSDESHTTMTVLGLFVYPIKGCAGVSLQTSQVDAFGLAGDRRWMVADPSGEFLSQRELPRLALISPRPSPGDGQPADGLVIDAPGMPSFALAADSARPVTAWCWDDRCAAFDEGDAAATWFSTFLGRPVRLLRFDDARPRHADARWAGGRAAMPGSFSRFSDGFPLLLLSQPSVDALNVRLHARGVEPVGVERFRPNLVVSADHAHEEDALESLTDGTVTLRRVKPCARCQVIEVDQRAGVAQAPGSLLDVLAGYRADASLGGGLAFGQNCIVTAGLGAPMRVGAVLSGRYAL